MPQRALTVPCTPTFHCSSQCTLHSHSNPTGAPGDGTVCLGPLVRPSPHLLVSLVTTAMQSPGQDFKEPRVSGTSESKCCAPACWEPGAGVGPLLYLSAWSLSCCRCCCQKAGGNHLASGWILLGQSPGPGAAKGSYPCPCSPPAGRACPPFFAFLSYCKLTCTAEHRIVPHTIDDKLG